MTKINRVAGALAVGTAFLLVIGLALPTRVHAQTAGQGQALGILLLLGLGPRADTHPPATGAKKPDGVVQKAAQPSGKLVRLPSDHLTGRTGVRSTVTAGPRAK